ncbi:protein FAM13A isoform X3 [Scleropages formosus]|uniref:Family with sequence similarity 13 member A n=1 Tax=Scleropages formosus TaxID=113540 RepID=A0A8C9SXF6_SCLFO|nr:protein FAM13A isoform X3 [Scleropages formosus]
MGAGALTICHNRAAAQIREDVKKMVQLPLLRQGRPGARDRRLFGVPLLELKALGLAADGVPWVVGIMVEFLREHALQQEGLFRVNGNVRVAEALRQRFESGEDVNLLQEGDVCVVASLLKQFLRELPEGVVTSDLQAALLQLYQECGEEQCGQALRDLLHGLPDVHYDLLRYLCRFLTQVAEQHQHNRMTALNLATVFGPNVFHVSPGFDGMREQNICNKIMAKLIQGYGDIFENDGGRGDAKEEHRQIITVKEAHESQLAPEDSPRKSATEEPTPVPRKKKFVQGGPPEHSAPPTEPASEDLHSTLKKKKKKKVKKVRRDDTPRDVPQPPQSDGLPHQRPLPTPRTRSVPGDMDLSSDDLMSPRSSETLNSSHEDDDRPISPFYMSALPSSPQHRAKAADVLERTVKSAVEQHLFGGRVCGGQSSEDSEQVARAPPAPPTPTARQRRRQQREQLQEQRHNNTEDGDKENIPAVLDTPGEGDRRLGRQGHTQGSPRLRQPRENPTLAQLQDNQHSPSAEECLSASPAQDRTGASDTEAADRRRDGRKESDSGLPSQTLAMKIQETQSEVGRAPRGPQTDACEDVPRLDLSALTEDSHWGDPSFFTAPSLDFKSVCQLSCCEEPVPAYSSWQRESMDREEARLSPHTGGRPIRQLLQEDSDPMLSPRFHSYGHCPQYLEDTEVPPSPPNTHPFMSRRRSSSLGSCEDDREELTSAQLSKKIHALKRKIRKYEEKFEEEHKYRPSHSDKAENPEVFRWMNELSKLRKELKEHQLMKSEEDLPPLTRQRSNTLPKSFGSQLDRRPQEKAPKPPVENTLEGVQKKLQEKREEAGRPEDIKDMTREQIVAEKVALQKALLYYESIHGRPVTNSERQIMKPLYDRYRLVKQILCRASAIPVIEEEDGSEDDGDAKTPLGIPIKSDFSMLGLLDHLDEDVDGFVSPVDELSPTKNSTDMRLSNLHSATMEELLEQLQEAREEKKRLRKNLREFEDQFFRQNGRNVQKEDRSPLAEEYSEYKHVKAKLRLLEVLISKRDSSKFI